MELFPDLPKTEAIAPEAYHVLARKYRPRNFAELVGQDALVRTLTNGLKTGRLAQAWMLTGIRGIGKTTTARIIAKALNCIGPDGKSGTTAEPCDICEPCRSIADGRCLDVLEMDAASRTGVDDMREILDGVRYAPTSVRYKVYIIDEVHMLSKNAFNALLKTLEEPPSQVKFIFATTEIRKVPLTILSRCQRFDLKRVDAPVLVAHFASIAEKEKANAEKSALQLIARAADGSVRDGLSLLDQAIANEDGEVTAGAVKTMLGLADAAQLFDLLAYTMKGDADGALKISAGLYASGADALTIVQDLLEQVHVLTRMKSIPNDASHTDFTDAGHKELASQLSIPVLTRAWQMLMKGLQEIQYAPNPQQALEMILMRMIYASDLPPTGDLARRVTEHLQNNPAPIQNSNAGVQSTSTPLANNFRVVHGTVGNAAVAQMPQQDMSLQVEAALASSPQTFPELVALFEKQQEVALYSLLYEATHLVKFTDKRLEIRPNAIAPKDFAAKLGSKLSDWTGQRWWVTISAEDGAETLAEQHRHIKRQELIGAADHPLVNAVLKAFPGARVIDIETIEQAEISTETGDDE